ncbi:hypothetical protein Vafri_20554, partial [Volvox africanus]
GGATEGQGDGGFMDAAPATITSQPLKPPAALAPVYIPQPVYIPISILHTPPPPPFPAWRHCHLHPHVLRPCFLAHCPRCVCVRGSQPPCSTTDTDTDNGTDTNSDNDNNNNNNNRGAIDTAPIAATATTANNANTAHTADAATAATASIDATTATTANTSASSTTSIDPTSMPTPLSLFQ